MPGSSAVTASWALSQTATDVVGVSRGMLEAATTDNVQPIALLACEAFGSTLPMSNETKAKMYQACSQDHQSAVLKFLQAQVGYKRGDSGWQLARSDSGLRFLGFATCLLSADLWVGSNLLRQLISDTAQDKVLVPSSQQLKQLLLKLQYRLENTGFLKDILGWNLLLNNKLATHCHHPSPPSAEVIGRLVKCTSSLARVGDVKHQLLKIKMPQNQAAWTIAFLKWFLGAPPTVKLRDGSVVIAQSFAQAEVYPVTDARNDDIEISVCDELETVRELFQDLKDGQDYVRGMISARDYVSAECQLFGPKESPYYVNAMLLIPCACDEAYRRLTIGANMRRIHVFNAGPSMSDVLRPIMDDLSRDGIEVTSGSLFPDEQTVIDTMRYLNPEGSIHNLKRIPEGSTVESLPPAIAVQQLFRTTCPCQYCCGKAKYRGSHCEFQLWLRTISRHVSTILLLSMIVPMDTTGVLLYYNKTLTRSRTVLSKVIYECLTGQQTTECSVSDVIQDLLILVGHIYDKDEDTEYWIASSRLGQTIYPQLLQSLEVQPRGLLKVVFLPGILTRNNVDYGWVKGVAIYAPIRNRDVEGHHSALNRLAPPISPRDEYPSTKLTWRISERENSLNLSVYVSTLAESSERNPVEAVWGGVGSVFVSCLHDADTPCSEVFLYQIDPHRKRNFPAGPAVGVALTHENETMRYFKLCDGECCVIRHQACLNCCLRVARLVDAETVIC